MASNEGWDMFAKPVLASEPPKPKPAWYGGNKIPESHLAKFALGGPNKDSGLPTAVDNFVKGL